MAEPGVHDVCSGQKMAGEADVAKLAGRRLAVADLGGVQPMAASCARGLRSAGVSAGDRVVLCMENRPEFPIAETALMAIRAVPVPAYTTNTVDDHAHLLRDSGARAAIVSSAVLAGRMVTAAASLGGLDLLVVMDPTAGPQRRRPGPALG